MLKRFCFSISLLLLCCDAFGQISVMTYNIRFDNPADSINAWPNRKSKVFDLLKKYNPDILGVQEALYHQMTDITAAVPDYFFVGVGRDDGKQKGEHSPIFFKKKRFELIEQQTFWLSMKPEVPGSKNWDAAITRVATWAAVKDKLNDRKFIVINTHFDHIGVEARKQSALLLKNKAAELGHDVPVIITGDFNCTREEDPYKIITNGELLELNDPSSDAPGTFCSFKVNSIPCKGIDYIFISSDWIADRYKVIADNDGSYYPSDHLPVMVNLILTD